MLVNEGYLGNEYLCQIMSDVCCIEHGDQNHMVASARPGLGHGMVQGLSAHGRYRLPINRSWTCRYP